MDDFKNIVNGTDVLTEDGMFYYGLAQQLHKAGYQAFDNISLYSFLGLSNFFPPNKSKNVK